MAKKRPFACAIVFFAGALAFWLPSIVIHAMRGSGFGAFDVLIVSIASPAAAAIDFLILCALEREGSLAWKASMFLLGVWVWGPPAMIVSATFSGGGFHSLSSVSGIAVMCAFFVITTPMMATYDGSLLALLVVTGILLVLFVATSIHSNEQGDLS